MGTGTGAYPSAGAVEQFVPEPVPISSTGLRSARRRRAACTAGSALRPARQSASTATGERAWPCRERMSRARRISTRSGSAPRSSNRTARRAVSSSVCPKLPSCRCVARRTLIRLLTRRLSCAVAPSSNRDRTRAACTLLSASAKASGSWRKPCGYGWPAAATAPAGTSMRPAVSRSRASDVVRRDGDDRRCSMAMIIPSRASRSRALPRCRAAAWIPRSVPE